MIFDRNTIEHLAGYKFSNGLPIPITTTEKKLPDRLSYLEQLSRGKNVIHVGCVDHMQLIEKKRHANTWLHDRLRRNAARCLGIDVNSDGIKHLKSNLAIEDVFLCDLLLDDLTEIRETKWDYMILGEIVEHVDDPVTFLSSIKKKYHSNVDRLIITVPNAFRLENFSENLRHRELINTDHRYWFTPFTLAKVLTRAACQAEEFHFLTSFPKKIRGPRSLIRDYFLVRFPSFRDTLAMTARI